MRGFLQFKCFYREIYLGIVKFFYWFSFQTTLKDLLIFIKKSINKSQNLGFINYQLGKKHFLKNKHTDAIFRFQLLQLLYKKRYKETVYYLGICYYYQGKYTKAEKTLKKYLKNNSQFQIETKYYLDLISNNNTIKSIPYSIRQMHAHKFTLLYNHLNNIIFKQIYKKLGNISNYNLGRVLITYACSEKLAKKLHDKFQFTSIEGIEIERSIGNKLKKSNLYKEIFYSDLISFNNYSKLIKYNTIFHNMIHEKDIKNITLNIKQILDYGGILIMGFIKNNSTNSFYFNNFMERFEFSENYIITQINKYLTYIFSKEVEFTNGEAMKIMVFKNDKN